jgi:nucleotide-binding universal stress UspA family protein
MPNRRRNPYFRRILVGYDGLPQADKAVEVAFSLAQSTDCKVLIFAVAPPPKPATMVELRAMLDEAQERFENGFARISRKAEELGVQLETAIVVGDPVEQIVHRTETEHMDLIILGHPARSWFARMVPQSVSGKLLRYVRCPVMLVQ